MKKIIMAAAVVCVVLSGVVYMATGCSKDKLMLMEPDTGLDLVQEESNNISVTETVGQNICVFVCGCVNTPGVYYLPQGSRAVDAIRMAGGTTEECNLSAINQAKILEDGEQLYLPSENEKIDYVNIQGTENSLININRATVEQLMTLPGIGRSRADSIIAFREEHGSFETIEDIMKISGIKEAAFNKIKELICV